MGMWFRDQLERMSACVAREFSIPVGNVPRTVFSNTNARESEYCPTEQRILIDRDSRLPKLLAFIWFHEIYHWIQFTVDKREYPLDFYSNIRDYNDEQYRQFWSEKEANAFALYMCEKYGFDWVTPVWLTEDYMKEIRDYVW